MAKTTRKEIIIDLKKISDPNLLDKIKAKINFIDVSLKTSKLNQVVVVLQGPRERINYASRLIKSFISESKISD